jgi:CO/xanthine dehydrogenase Mo-binding subunit
MSESASAPPRRSEDPRLLTGRALFVDDVHLEGMLHVAFLRSDFAHGRIVSVDVSAALDRPGVVAAYTAWDLGDYWKPGPLLVAPPPRSSGWSSTPRPTFRWLGTR